MYFEYEFNYKTNVGDHVVVAVSYEAVSGDPYSVESDWDYRGGFFLDVKSITKDGLPYEGEITVEEIQKELIIRLRDDEIESVMYENESF